MTDLSGLAKLFPRYALLICMFVVLGCSPRGSKWPPWKITDENSLVTVIDLPFSAKEENSVGRIFYDLDREQIYFEAYAWKLKPPNRFPRVDKIDHTDYYYIDTNRKALEKTVNNDNVFELKGRHGVFVSDTTEGTEVYEQPFGNLELKSTVNYTISYPVRIAKFPPGTGTFWDTASNGTVKVELKVSGKSDNIFSLSENYTGGFGGYRALFTPDGLYAIIEPKDYSSERLFQHNLIVIGELPVSKDKSEIKAIVRNEVSKRVAEDLLYKLME